MAHGTGGRTVRITMPAALLAAGIVFGQANAQSPQSTAGATPAKPSVSTGTGAPAASLAKSAAPTPGKPSATAGKRATSAKAQSGATPKAATARHRYQPDRFAGRAGKYYRMVWGVDSLIVRWAESGEVIRFSYRVLDPEKAKVLNDKKAEPALIDPRAGVSLSIPALENVGQLRASGDPEEGKSYWMTFSNRGHPVRRGDHVIVVIGQFRADGLVVD
jgi:hypothetical protein